MLPAFLHSKAALEIKVHIKRLSLKNVIVITGRILVNTGFCEVVLGVTHKKSACKNKRL